MRPDMTDSDEATLTSDLKRRWKRSRCRENNPWYTIGIFKDRLVELRLVRPDGSAIPGTVGVQMSRSVSIPIYLEGLAFGAGTLRMIPFSWILSCRWAKKHRKMQASDMQSVPNQRDRRFAPAILHHQVTNAIVNRTKPVDLIMHASQRHSLRIAHEVPNFESPRLDIRSNLPFLPLCRSCTLP